MKIGIDARMLGSGFGLARYVQQLVMHLEKIDSEHQFVLFMKKDNWDEVPLPLSDFGELSRIGGAVPQNDGIPSEGGRGGRTKQIDVGLAERPPLTPPHRGGNFRKVLADIPWYTLEEQLKFKKIIKKEGVDLMHFPHWNIPFFYNDPFVVTIHDLTMFHYPRPEATTRGRFVFWIKDKAHRIIIRHAVKKAKHIITTSEFTRQDIHKTLGVTLEKMATTYQAPFEKTSDFRLQTSEAILKKFGIIKPYVLYVGAAYPHKNLDRLVEAWKLFEEKNGDDYQLVLAGKNNYFYERLKSEVQSPKSIIFTDFVLDDELSVLYKNAQLFVFPSLYEGFGLPPLEAMSLGVPVVSSNSSCLPEVLGDAALYFDPENIEEMSEKIYLGLTDEDIRFDLKQNAKNNLIRFSWDRLARKTQGIYERHS